MRMYDIIQKKRDGLELTDREIEFAVEGYVGGDVPDTRYRPCSWPSISAG